MSKKYLRIIAAIMLIVAIIFFIDLIGGNLLISPRKCL